MVLVGILEHFEQEPADFDPSKLNLAPTEWTVPLSVELPQTLPTDDMPIPTHHKRRPLMLRVRLVAYLTSYEAI